MRAAIRFVLLLCTATMLHAQAPVQQPRFALEISEDGFPPLFVIVHEGQQGGGMFFSFALHQLPGDGARSLSENSSLLLLNSLEKECKCVRIIWNHGETIPILPS